MARRGDAQGRGYQVDARWPPPDTPGIATVGGRTFHRAETCWGYQQGVRNSVKYGRKVNPVEALSARQAKDRGKSACSVCWKGWM